MATRIQLRRGMSSTWTANNPELAQGELGFETDTGKFKIGNGTQLWNDLAYATVTPADLEGIQVGQGIPNPFAMIG